MENLHFCVELINMMISILLRHILLVWVNKTIERVEKAICIEEYCDVILTWCHVVVDSTCDTEYEQHRFDSQP